MHAAITKYQYIAIAIYFHAVVYIDLHVYTPKHPRLNYHMQYSLMHMHACVLAVPHACMCMEPWTHYY